MGIINPKYKRLTPDINFLSETLKKAHGKIKAD